MRKQQMDEAMKRQMNKRAKDVTNETVANSKMQAAMRQKAVALDTKAEKEMVRMRNQEQRAQEEARARNMKHMILA